MPPSPSAATTTNTTTLVIFCFRRDLRVNDNLGLHALLREACASTPSHPSNTIRVYPVFCMDPRQIDPSKNNYRSNASIRFLFESLVDLNGQIQGYAKLSKAATKASTGLTVLYGQPDKVLPEWVTHLVSTTTTPTVQMHIGWNDDVTPFSIARDEAITKALHNMQRRLSSSSSSSSSSSPSTHLHLLTNRDDVTVVPIHDITTQSGSVYKVFTPFMRKARAKGVRAPAKWSSVWTTRCIWEMTSSSDSRLGPLAKRLVPVASLYTDPRFACPSAPVGEVRGGRTAGLARLRAGYLQRRCKQYAKARDTPGEEHTTRWSAYLKFGCVSFREAHAAIVSALHAHYPTAQEALTRELFWNAFYAYITFHFPHVLQGQTGGTRTRNMEMHSRLHNKADSLWVTPVSRSVSTRKAFARWTSGTTGFPFVDAAMRQLLTTGWMHNRARMVVASFLTKDLRIDWREGERHFAQHLVDYDPSSNNGGWQWAASTGADAQPYFRIFNPWTQGLTHDRDAVYIKRFVPELKAVPPKDIHRWHDRAIRRKYARHKAVQSYPEPMVDHSGVKGAVLGLWKKV